MALPGTSVLWRRSPKARAMPYSWAYWTRYRPIFQGDFMQIGIIGLGRMGANIGRRLMAKGHAVVGYDRDAKAVAGLQGASGASDLKDMVGKLSAPRAVWVMLPAGKITEDTIAALGELL